MPLFLYLGFFLFLLLPLYIYCSACSCSFNICLFFFSADFSLFSKLLFILYLCLLLFVFVFLQDKWKWCLFYIKTWGPFCPPRTPQWRWKWKGRDMKRSAWRSTPILLLPLSTKSPAECFLLSRWSSHSNTCRWPESTLITLKFWHKHFSSIVICFCFVDSWRITTLQIAPSGTILSALWQASGHHWAAGCWVRTAHTLPAPAATSPTSPCSWLTMSLM